jgi:ribosome-binding factor A
VARAVRLKYAPELHFQPDTALDHAVRMSALLRRPEVARDLAPREAEEE